MARGVLARHDPKTTLVNIGGTADGIGAVYTLAKKLGFETTGILSERGLRYPETLSPAVDHLCIMQDEQYGGTLPGTHHFYITFKTRMPGVEIPKHLSQRVPDEMTIVIQHRFWDLHVAPDYFTVGLSFGGVPATLPAR